MLWRLLKSFHTNLEARVIRHYRSHEIEKVLSVAHAEELARTPGELWPVTKSRHVQEIQAVRDGKFDIVDRRTWVYPYLPEALHRLNQPILKNTPYNLRRFSETPIPRRAINLIKNAILSLEWRVDAVPDVEDQESSEREKRIRIVTECLKHPNNVDSWRTFAEALLEDQIIGGYGVIEPRMTPFYKRPFKMWTVDGTTIRFYADWTESEPDRPRYAQMTGLKGERGIVAFLHDELIYIKDNVRSSTPFGLGKLEVAFNSVNAFLGAQDMAAKAGADQVHKTWLWFQQPQNPAHVQRLRRHIQNELEGQQKISIMAGMPRPDVVNVQAVTEADLLLNWQEFLIRIISQAFDLSPMALGLERDVNRSTGEIMAMTDFRAAVTPTARRIEEAMTRELLHGFLGWKDLEFKFIGLEDPDMMTKTQIQQGQYMMNAITPDEIRESVGKPPLTDGWGKLTNIQTQIMMVEASAQAAQVRNTAGIPTQVPSGMPGEAGGGMSGGGFRTPASGPGGISPSGMTIGAAGFMPEDIAGMSPAEIQWHQKMGNLPGNQQIVEQMQQQAPNLLQTLTDELKQYFEMQDLQEKQNKTKPQKISNADEAKQVEKWKKKEHTPTLVETALNDRYNNRRPRPELELGPASKLGRAYGPRSGGVRGNYR